jgi:hypothetical protein
MEGDLQICNEAIITNLCTEPYSPTQTRAEIEIKELKKELGVIRAKFENPASIKCVGFSLKLINNYNYFFSSLLACQVQHIRLGSK